MDLDWEAVEAAGLLDDAADPEDRRALLQYLGDEGLDLGELLAAQARGGLLRAAGDRHIRPGAGALSLRDVADRLDVDPDLVRRTWRSLGAVDPGDLDALVASEDDVDLVRATLLQIEVFGERTGWALVRRFRVLLERATEAMSAAAIAELPDISTQHSGSEAITAKTWTELAALVPDTGRVLDLALRHHIDAVRRHFEAAASPSGQSRLDLGIGFADLTGYTSTSLALDFEELGGLVGDFEDRAAAVVADHGGRIVKFAGDAAMFVCVDPDALAAIALALAEGGPAAALTARVGCTYGTVLARDGDYFGPVVNLAARLVDVAPPQTVLVDADLRAVLDGDRWRCDEQAAVSLRGLPEPFVPYLLRPA